MRRLFLVATLLTIAFAAHAQQPATTPTQAPPQTFTFTDITVQELQMIGMGLDSVALPRMQTGPLIEKLQKQFAAQLPKPAEPEKKP